SAFRQIDPTNRDGALTSPSPPPVAAATKGGEGGRRPGEGGGNRVLAIGTDCLEITAELIQQAITSLATHDAVFGPTPDDGYYLIGTARHIPGFFDGIRWSSLHTLADHTEHCRESSWSFALLPMLTDIDTEDDWIDYCRRKGT